MLGCEQRSHLSASLIFCASSTQDHAAEMTHFRDAECSPPDREHWAGRPGEEPRHDWGTIGVVGGMGHVSTIHFYSVVVRLFQQRYGATRNSDYPRICIHGIAGADNTETLSDGSLLTDLSLAVNYLTRAGADFICVPCNTVHNLLSQITVPTAPVLDIVRLTVTEVAHRRPASVLLLATERTLYNRLYQVPLEGYGIKTLVPAPDQQAIVSASVLQINAGIPAHALADQVRRIIDAFPGADGVVLGCTELSLLSPVLTSSCPPVVDSLTTLAEEAFVRSTTPQALSA